MTQAANDKSQWLFYADFGFNEEILAAALKDTMEAVKWKQYLHTLRFAPAVVVPTMGFPHWAEWITKPEFALTAGHGRHWQRWVSAKKNRNPFWTPSTSIPRMWMHENSWNSPTDHVAVYTDERIAFTFMDGNMPDTCARILAVLIIWTIACKWTIGLPNFVFFSSWRLFWFNRSGAIKRKSWNYPHFLG